MKTTDQTSDRITATPSPDTRWYRVRPALRWTLAVGVGAWLGLLGTGTMRGIGSPEFLTTAAPDASSALTVLAAASVAAVLVEGLRISGRLHKLRRKLGRSMRVTQRLVLGSRTA